MRGLISRRAIGDELGLSEALRRCPEVEVVFSAADTRAGHFVRRYSKYDHLAGRLIELLRGPNVPVRNGRASHVWAADQLGLPVHAVRNAPRLRQLLDESRPGRVGQDARSIPSVLDETAEAALSLLGDSRHELTSALNLSFASLAAPTRTQRWGALFHLLRWLDETPEHQSVLASWRSGAAPERDAFQHATSAWRYELLRRKHLKATTQSGIIGNLRRVLAVLHAAGLAPDVTSLRPVKNARRKTDPRPSVAQATRDPLLVALDEEAQSRGLEAWSNDRAAFIAALREDAPQGAEDFVTAIRDLNRSRLHAVREAAEAVFIRGLERWQDGAAILSLVQKPPLPFDQLAASSENRSQRELLEEYIRALALWNGALPPKSLARPQQHRFAHVKLLRKCGGYQEVADRLHASNQTVAAAVVLYLVDSGANVQVARTLRVDALSPSNNAGHTTIAGHKSTANGKAIRSDLPNTEPRARITTVKALTNLCEMLQPLRAAAPQADKDTMFLVRPQQAVKGLSGLYFHELFKGITDAHPLLSGLRLSPSMIRTSVLLDLALAREGRLEAVRAKAHHATLNQTDGYTRKFPVRLIYEQKIRRFQDSLEALVLADTPDTLVRLGVNGERVRLRAAEAQRTGLGFLCGAPLAGVQPDASVGEPCHRLDRCVDCAARLVVAEPELIADLVLFNRALWRAEASWSSERPERWEAVWLPNLALTEVALEQMTRGPLARALREGKALAEARLASGEALVELW